MMPRIVREGVGHHDAKRGPRRGKVPRVAANRRSGRWERARFCPAAFDPFEKNKTFGARF